MIWSRPRTSVCSRDRRLATGRCLASPGHLSRPAYAFETRPARTVAGGRPSHGRARWALRWLSGRYSKSPRQREPAGALVFLLPPRCVNDGLSSFDRFPSFGNEQEIVVLLQIGRFSEEEAACR